MATVISTLPDFRTRLDCKPSTVKRCLFGEPDHEYVRSELIRQLEMIAQQDCKKYNFDFINERPLEGSFKWETYTMESDLPNEKPEPSPKLCVLSVSETITPEKKTMTAKAKVKRCPSKAKTTKPANTAHQTRLTDYYSHKKRATTVSPSVKTFKRRHSDVGVTPPS